MNIVHCGIMVNGRNEGLSKAFKKVANRYAEIKLDKNAQKQLKAVDFEPDLIFFQIHNDTVDGVPTNELFDLSKFDCKIVNWNGDMRKRPPMWMKSFKGIPAFSNMRDVEAIGGKFLQIGIDDEVFKRWYNKRNDDIVFMGNNYGNTFPLGQYRKEAVMILQRRGAKIYGNYPNSNGNLNADPNNPFDKQSEESKIYSQCAIAISISHFNIDRYTSDRLLRCMGSGAFTLTHHYPGILHDRDWETGY